MYIWTIPATKQKIMFFRYEQTKIWNDVTATSREHIDFIVGLLIIIRWHLTAGRKRAFM